MAVRSLLAIIELGKIQSYQWFVSCQQEGLITISTNLGFIMMYSMC